jgi:transposase-like protein
MAAPSTTGAIVPPLVCPVCRSPEPVAASKPIDASTYWRCRKCGEVWNVGRRQTGGALPPRRAW